MRSRRGQAGRGRGQSHGSKPSRKRARVAGLAALALILSSGVSVATFSGTDYASAAVKDVSAVVTDLASAAVRNASAAVQHAKGFLQLIQQRSPGKRTRAQLTKMQHKPKLVLRERALPKIRPPAPVFPVVEEPPPLIDLVSSIPPAPVAFEFAEVVPPTQTPPPEVPIPLTPLVVPPIVTPPPVITPSAVPEPSSWMLLLLGFGLLGWLLRRAQSSREAPVS